MLKLDDHAGNLGNSGFEFLKNHLASSVDEVTLLRDVDKLLFCLLLPVDGPLNTLGTTVEESDVTTLDSSLGYGILSTGSAALHLSNQIEHSQAFTWIMSHLEEHHSTCLRKDEVFEDYKIYCEKHRLKCLNTADFGKVMKRAFPNVKPRRLGQRGQSRYCYGGMRKKVEVKPPYLPDIGVDSGYSIQQKYCASPNSSSSGDTSQRPFSSGSPTPRSRHNGPDLDIVSWADEPAVRNSLGAHGSIVSDIANVLLEYAQQVFGLQFTSLFHLARHLVNNRYVNSRSRHALSLTAYEANQSTLSPSPNMSECIQKGSSRSAFDRVGNCRQSLNLKTESSPIDPMPNSVNARPSPNTPIPTNDYLTKSPVITGREIGPGRTPIYSDSPGSNLHPVRFQSTTTVNIPNSPSQAKHSPLTVSSSQQPTTPITSRQTSSTPNHLHAPSSGSAMPMSTPVQPQLTVSPGHASSAYSSILDIPATDAQEPSFDNLGLSGYLAPVNNSTLEAAHQQSCQPILHHSPGPLAPSIGARSPYSQVGPFSNTQSSSGNKRTTPLRPVEAPGSYEPSPRFNLGGQSPVKRARYFSTNSGSSLSTTNSISTDCTAPALDHSSTEGSLNPSAISPSNSSASSSNNYPTVSQPETRITSQQPRRPIEPTLSNSMLSPLYSQQYDSLELRSPNSLMSGSSGIDRIRSGSNRINSGVDFWKNNHGSMFGQDHSTEFNRQRGYLSSGSSSMFRPPITPFMLDLEDSDDPTNLPRLGTSPGPQLQPISPSEYLPYYSENSSKTTSFRTSSRLRNLDSEECDGILSDHPSSNGSSDSRYISKANTSLETPPPSALVTSADVMCPTLANSPGSSDSDDPHNRTLTHADSIIGANQTSDVSNNLSSSSLLLTTTSDPHLSSINAPTKTEPVVDDPAESATVDTLGPPIRNLSMFGDGHILRRFDAFAKPIKDYRIKTTSGAITSIVSIVIIFILFILELYSFLTPSTRQEISVDVQRGEKMQIGLDLTFPRVPCDSGLCKNAITFPPVLSLDAMDATGQEKIAVKSEVEKVTIDASGNVVDSKPLTTNSPNVCGSCYGAESPTRKCCNTCQDIEDAYREKKWSLGNVSNFNQCRNEKVDQQWSHLGQWGCRFHGNLEVNRVSGSFHISPGQSYTEGHAHVHSIMGISDPRFNLSHSISKFNFGTGYPGMINPLDATDMNLDIVSPVINYFIKIVPTIAKHDLSQASPVYTNQYSATWYSGQSVLSGGNSGAPGVFFIYEIAPILVQLTTESKSVFHFLTNTCAIVGGVYTVASIVDAFIYHSMCLMNKRA